MRTRLDAGQTPARPGHARGSACSRLRAALLAAGCSIVAFGAFAARAVAVTYTQTKLPFPGMGTGSQPFAVALDSAGDVYVAGLVYTTNPYQWNARVFELPKGGLAITVPLSGLTDPSGVAVDSAGNLFVADAYTGRVYEVSPDGTQTTLSIANGMDGPLSVAVDSAGDLFVAEPFNYYYYQGDFYMEHGRVVEQPKGASSPTTLVFDSTVDPGAIAVDQAGNLFLAEPYRDRVSEIPAGSSSPITLPFSGLKSPGGIAVDAADNVYVSDTGNNRVLELPGGASSPITVPFTGLDGVQYAAGVSGLAVDAARDVFVSDPANDQVLELSQQQPQSISWAQPGPYTYGQAPDALNASASSGLPVSYRVKSGPCAVSAATLTLTGAGSCVVDVDQAGNGTYSAAPQQERTLVIEPAQLTVTADNQARQFGAPNPLLTATIGAFVNGETLASSGVNGAAACSAAASSSSPSGSYPITCTQGTLTATNYVFANPTAGTLTVSATNTMTGAHAGPTTVSSGQSLLISPGATANGPVTVESGGALEVEGGTITGPLSATGATAIRVCKARITGPATIANSSGLVLLGDDDGPASCAGDTITGPVKITGGTGGVEFDTNNVSGPLTITGNTGSLPAPDRGSVDATGNSVSGPQNIQK